MSNLFKKLIDVLLPDEEACWNCKYYLQGIEKCSFNNLFIRTYPWDWCKNYK